MLRSLFLIEFGVCGSWTLGYVAAWQYSRGLWWSSLQSGFSQDARNTLSMGCVVALNAQLLCCTVLVYPISRFCEFAWFRHNVIMLLHRVLRVATRSGYKYLWGRAIASWCWLRLTTSHTCIAWCFRLQPYKRLPFPDTASATGGSMTGQIRTLTFGVRFGPGWRMSLHVPLTYVDVFWCPNDLRRR